MTPSEDHPPPHAEAERPDAIPADLLRSPSGSSQLPSQKEGGAHLGHTPVNGPASTRTQTDASSTRIDLAAKAMRARLAQRMFPSVADDSSRPRIGRYRIARRLGTGGMGDVYEAHDPDLERRVAVKILHPDLSHRHRTRLRREALALAKLSHPCIAHVYEVGEHESTLFIALEFIDGITLAEWQKKTHPNEWRVTLGKYIEAGKALASAHRMGIVHRDFKPSNVMVRHDGRVCILDFGLAKTFREDELARTEGDEPIPPSLLSERVTVTGTMLGTPAYMSLEQLLGESVDAHSDQFSFCVALWEAMYGARPFTGSNPTELARDLAERKPRVPADSPRRPPWLRRALIRGLASSPEQRWPSMAELLDALVAPRTGRNLLFAGSAMLLAGSAVWWFPSSPDPCVAFDAQVATIVSPEATEKRKQAFAASGFPDAENVWQHAESSLNAATQEWSRARDSWCGDLGEQTMHSSAPQLMVGTSCLEQRLAKLEITSSILASVTPELIEQLPWVLAELEAEPTCSASTQAESDESIEAHKQLAKARVLIRASHFGDAGEIVRSVLEQASARADERMLAEATYVHARLLMEQDKHDDSRTKLNEALSLALKTNHLTVQADVLLNLTADAHDSGKTESAEYGLSQAAAVITKLEPQPGPRTVSLLRSRSHIARLRGDHHKALLHAEEALALAKRVFTENSVEIAETYRALGHAKRMLDRTDEARDAYSRALGLLRDNVGLAADVEYDIGTMYLSTMDFERASEQFKTTKETLDHYPADLFRLTRARLLSGLAQAHLSIGKAKLSRGESEACRDDFEAAREAISASDALVSTTLAPTHPTRLNNTIARRYANEALERWQDVITDCHTLAVSYETLGNWSKSNRAHACVAEAHDRAGNPDQGIAYLDGVLAASRRSDVKPYALLTVHANKVELEGLRGKIDDRTLFEAESVLSLAPEDLDQLTEARAIIAEGRARYEIKTAERGRYDVARESTLRAIDLAKDPAAKRDPEHIASLTKYFETTTGTRLTP